MNTNETTPIYKKIKFREYRKIKIPLKIFIQAQRLDSQEK